MIYFPELSGLEMNAIDWLFGPMYIGSNIDYAIGYCCKYESVLICC